MQNRKCKMGRSFCLLHFAFSILHFRIGPNPGPSPPRGERLSLGGRAAGMASLCDCFGGDSNYNQGTFPRKGGAMSEPASRANDPPPAAEQGTSLTLLQRLRANEPE